MTGRIIPWPASRKRVLLQSDAIGFQEDLDDILAEPPPALLRHATTILAGLLLSLVVLAACLRTDIVVSGTGRLAMGQGTIMLQPLERAVLRDIRVRSGDAVVKGQILATLDPTFADADIGNLAAQRQAASAALAQLEAEADGHEPPAAARPNDAQALQSTLFGRRRMEHAFRMQGAAEMVRRDEASIAGLESDRASLERQRAIAQTIEELRARLMRDAVGSRLQLLDAQNALLQADREFRSTADRIAELHHGIEARRADMREQASSWRREILEQIVVQRAERERVEAELAKAARLRDLVTLRAPQDGTVLQVASRAPGSIIKEAEPLITILPAGAELSAQVDVGSIDIGPIARGDAVILKVDAFPYQLHGTLRGIVRAVGEESYSPSDPSLRGAVDAQAGRAPSGAFHRVEVAVLDRTLAGLPSGERLLAGMTVTAEVKVGTRNVLAYFLYPVTRGFAESFREP